MSKSIFIVIINSITDKKTKSIGNRCMIKMVNNTYLIDYYIQYFSKCFVKPNIIIIDSDECDNLNKYISTKYNNIQYIYHKIEHNSNIGQSIALALNNINNADVFITSSNIVPHKNLKLSNKKTGVISISSGNIGCLCQNEKITHCFYTLDNPILDCFFINHKDLANIKDIINSNRVHNYYLFEIINLLVDNGIDITLNKIKDKQINIIDSLQKIQHIQKLKI